jgi:hypothetical protein
MIEAGKISQSLSPEIDARQVQQDSSEIQHLILQKW